MYIESHSTDETKKLGRLFGEELKHAEFQKTGAVVVALIGTLGSGKTTFVQGFAKGIGSCGRIASPTFILARIHRISDSNFSRFVHMDAYRLSSIHDLPPLGFNELLRDPKTIILVEWADIIRSALPNGTIVIRSAHCSSSHNRRFSFSIFHNK